MKTEKFSQLILERQQADGSWRPEAGIDSVFLTALVLSCLNRGELSEDLAIARQRAELFLLSKADKNWQFSQNLFVNFSVIVALAEYDLEIFDGAALAAILKLLTKLEVQLGGPYYSRENSQKIDLAFNLQVARFLSLFEVDLPNLTAYFSDAMATENYQSAYFVSPFPVLYFFSKFSEFTDNFRIKEFIAKSDLVNKPLDQLFILNSFKNIGFNEEDLEKYQSNFSIEKISESDNSSVLSAALAWEYYSPRLAKMVEKKNEEVDEMILKILESATTKFSTLSADMQEIAAGEIARTMAKNNDHQMALMPFYVKKALGEKGEIFSDDFIAAAGLANIFFWNAFIIYDDFWDEEGEPCYLPTANYYARYFFDFYFRIFAGNQELRQYFHELMDKLDQANTWETKHCRATIGDEKLIIPTELPDYGDYELAYAPASAHILGAVMMLCRLGYDLESAEMKNLENYFRHYLIAMQINDDALDWEEDLERGHLSTVVVMFIRRYQEKYPGTIFLDLRLENRDVLKQFYWYEVIEPMCQAVLEQTQKAQEALAEMSVFEDSGPLTRMIERSAAVAHKTLQDFADKNDFLENFF